MSKHERTYSEKIRLYAPVYNEYMKKREEKSPKIKVSELKKPVSIIPSSKKKKEKKEKDPLNELNDYQKFVQKESKKEHYKNFQGKKRLEEIAKAWEKHKRKEKKHLKEKKSR